MIWGKIGDRGYKKEEIQWWRMNLGGGGEGVDRGGLYGIGCIIRYPSVDRK